MKTRVFPTGLALTSFVVLSLSGMTLNAEPAKSNKNTLPASSQSYGSPLPPLVKQHLLGDTFVPVKTVSALPPSVLNELAVPKKKLEQWTGGKLTPAEIADLMSRGRMADPGQPFEMTDVVGPKPLPFRRLIFAGVSGEYCFVYDEYGGIVPGTELSLYRLPPSMQSASPGAPISAGQSSVSRATLVWQASLQDPKTFLTWDQLRQAISQGRYCTRYIPPAPPAPVFAQ